MCFLWYITYNKDLFFKQLSIQVQYCLHGNTYRSNMTILKTSFRRIYSCIILLLLILCFVICFADVWCNIRTYSTHVHKVNLFFMRLYYKWKTWNKVLCLVYSSFELAEERVFVWHQRGEKYQKFNDMNYCLYRCPGRTTLFSSLIISWQKVTRSCSWFLACV